MRFFVISAKKTGALLCAVLAAAALFTGARVREVFMVNGREIPIYSVERIDNKIALTFDCAWNDSDIPQICSILKKHGVHATFFVVGDWAEKYPDSVRMLAENGHEIGNHSYDHAHYAKLGTQQLIEDMDKCDEVIRSLTGWQATLVRAPYGEYNDTVIRACESSGRTYIQWSVDSIDYGGADKASIIKRSTEKTHAGDIILLHNGTDNTAAALDEILSILCEKYEPVTISELIYKDDFEIDHAGCQRRISKSASE